jgi:hypothetical protein
MVQNVLDKAPEILNAINPTIITGAKVEFVDVVTSENSERKCILKIFVVTAAPKETSVSITDISGTDHDDPMLLDSATSQADLSSGPSSFVIKRKKHLPILTLLLQMNLLFDIAKELPSSMLDTRMLLPRKK